MIIKRYIIPIGLFVAATALAQHLGGRAAWTGFIAGSLFSAGLVFCLVLAK